MADYCTEAELEGQLGVGSGYFSGTSNPTTTVVAEIITRASRTIDAVVRGLEDAFGADPSQEDIKTATIEVASAIIKGRWDIEQEMSSIEIYNLAKLWLGVKSREKRRWVSKNTLTSDEYTSNNYTS